MKSHSIDIAKAIPQAEQLASAAKTPMYFAIGNQLHAIIAVADPIKEDSAEAIKRLQNKGIQVVMLTGDNQATAKAVASKVGITDFIAQLMPDDKAGEVTKRQSQGENGSWPQFGLAVALAALAGWVCIGVFLALLRRVGLFPFVVYRLFLGLILLWLVL